MRDALRSITSLSRERKPLADLRQVSKFGKRALHPNVAWLHRHLLRSEVVVDSVASVRKQQDIAIIDLEVAALSKRAREHIGCMSGKLA